MEEHGDQTQLLPDDVLAAVLARLAPRDLATSRCVCKPWRDTIDARRILRAELLPHSLAGFFINFNDLRYSEFFSRPPPSPSEGPGIQEKELIYLTMQAHCNGLLLVRDTVANPATGWRAPLPPSPPKTPGMECFIDDAYLAYDPTLSPHYQVLLLPRVPYIELDIEPDEYPLNMVDPAMFELEWPPSSCVLPVFSSFTKRWEKKAFSRVGEAAGTVLELGIADLWDNSSTAVYWHGTLYVQCQKGFVIRLSLSSNTYQVIKPPEDLEPESCETIHHLGKSRKGVYYASIKDSYQLQVWVLNESCAYTKWELEHDRHFNLLLNDGQQVYGPWILQDVNYNEEEYINVNGDDGTSVVEGNFRWDSDDDEEEGDAKDLVDKFNGGISILGFHPFKEIVFLSADLSRGLAYHLNTSKIQHLGNLCPKHYHGITRHGFIRASFPYTPCWME
ncbi:uncharacterized protein [Lolium perenne]|uniref:uncharacterized protein n=1 Tax=Lolium perenne TaxID=4522 RepID=UPI0021EB0A5D|nr:uncharacterized protein LOC127325461 [Lolium perenne]